MYPVGNTEDESPIKKERPEYNHEMQIWDIYYAGLCAMLLHPGYNKPGTKIPTLEDLAAQADEMVRHSNHRKISCRG